MSIRSSFTKIRAISLIALAAGPALAQPPIGPVTTNRPMVVILTQYPGPTAPKDQQWQSATIQPAQTIPANFAAGIDTDLNSGAVNGGACPGLFGLELDLDITHPRPAGLIITLERLSPDGSRVAYSNQVFNGPMLAAKSLGNAASISVPTGTDVSAALVGTETLAGAACSSWRLNVADLSIGTPGTLNSWTLKFRTAWFPFNHDLAYYQDLFFGSGVVTPNLVDYFREVSRGKFTFTQAQAILGPATLTGFRLGESDFDHMAQVVHLLEDQGVNFAAFDKNHDGRITGDELTIVPIDNGGENNGAARYVKTKLNHSSLVVDLYVAGVSQQVNFHTLAHEVAHTFGAADIYGVWDQECLSDGLTLMSCEPGTPDISSVMYLDAWHRSKFDWYTPVGLTFRGFPYQLGDETYTDSYGNRSRPATLHNPNDPTEYYIFEYRTRRGYDLGLASAGEGVLAWHALEDKDGQPLQTPHRVYNDGPDNDVGSSLAWSPADGKFQLRWVEGTLIPLSFWIEQPVNSGSSVILHGDPIPAGYQNPPDVQILEPVDNTGPLGRTFFLAKVTVDPACDPHQTSIIWSNNVDQYMGTGALLRYTFFQEGHRTVTVTVKDSFGGVTRKSIDYTVTKGAAPVATIFNPTANQTFYRNQPVYLSGAGSSAVVLGFPCDHLTWTADRLPQWSMQGCTGHPPFNITGPVVFTLTVTDDDSQTGQASVTVNFVDPSASSPPVVTILSPEPNSRIIMNQYYTVNGTVTDPAGGPVTYRWTVFDPYSNREIELGSTPTFQWYPGSMIFVPENIELRLYGTNNRGATTVAKQQYFVEGPVK